MVGQQYNRHEILTTTPNNGITNHHHHTVVTNSPLPRPPIPMVPKETVVPNSQRILYRIDYRRPTHHSFLGRKNSIMMTNRKRKWIRRERHHHVNIVAFIRGRKHTWFVTVRTIYQRWTFSYMSPLLYIRVRNRMKTRRFTNRDLYSLPQTMKSLNFYFNKFINIILLVFIL